MLVVHGAVDDHIGKLGVRRELLRRGEAPLWWKVVEMRRLLPTVRTRIGDPHNAQLVGMSLGIGGVEQGPVSCPHDDGGDW